jgi:N-terminal domain of NWD NACHT-NTPase/NACHT domain
MDWYWNLSSLLLQENAVGGGSSETLRYELEKRIVALYKALLLYQMKSVCSYYRNRGVDFLRSVVQLDDWDGSLTNVHEAEDAVRQDSATYNNQQIKSHLEQLVIHAKDRETNLLQDIYQALQKQLLIQEKQFLIQMSGEDRQCLKDLRLTDPRDDKTRIGQTKGGLLKDSYRWILDNDDFSRWRNDDHSSLLWIKGDPGKGKTMLLIGIINELSQHSDRLNHNTGLPSFFFCQATDSQLNNAIAVLRGLIYLLIVQQKSLDQTSSLISYVRKKYDDADRQLFEDTNAFYALSQIFKDILRDPSLKGSCLVIDALDECQTGLLELLDLITNIVSEPLICVKWIVSSRYRDDIEQRLRLDNSRVRLSLELNANHVSHAVDVYIDWKISELTSVKEDKELQDQVRNRVRQKANGTFLWVALVFRELQEVRSWDVLQVVEEVPDDLKSLYSRMMRQIQQQKRNDPEFCRRVLSAVTIAYRPLHLHELATLSGLPERIASDTQFVANIVGMCGSFLTVRDEHVYLIHQSAKDYLIKEGFATVFPSGYVESHYSIFSRSLKILSQTLRRDIYKLYHPGLSVNHVEKIEKIDPDPLAAARYSCIYWVEHLNETDRNYLRHQNDLNHGGVVHQFFQRFFLYWLEALSLIRGMPDGVVAITKLETILKVSPTLRYHAQCLIIGLTYFRTCKQNPSCLVWSKMLDDLFYRVVR